VLPSLIASAPMSPAKHCDARDRARQKRRALEVLAGSDVGASVVPIDRGVGLGLGLAPERTVTAHAWLAAQEHGGERRRPGGLCSGR